MIRSLSFLIPSYRDALTIGTVINEANAVGKALKIPFEILVVNDASPDNLADVLRELKKKIPQLAIITHFQNKGYGATIRQLYTTGSKQWLFTIPGDYQVGAKELKKLIPHSNSFDMVVGRRIERNDLPSRKRQSSIYNAILQKLFHIPVHDANSVRLMKQSIINTIQLTSTSAFVDAELVLRAQRAGYRIAEVPIVHRRRAHGAGKGGGGSMRTILPTMIDIAAFALNTII